MPRRKITPRTRARFECKCGETVTYLDPGINRGLLVECECGRRYLVKRPDTTITIEED